MKKQIERKKCTVCKVERGITQFGSDVSAPDGHNLVCKLCMRELKRKKLQGYQTLSDVTASLKKVNDLAIRTLDKVADFDPTVIGLNDMPHMVEVVGELMNVFGGARGYAAQLMAQYQAAEVGSTTRTELLKIVARLNAQASIAGFVNKPLENLTDEELEQLEQRKVMAAKLKIMGSTTEVEEDYEDGGTGIHRRDDERPDGSSVAV